MPVPISCVPTRTSTPPSRCAITCASGPDTPTACHSAEATPTPRLIGPLDFAASFFSAHRNAFAPISYSGRAHRVVAVTAPKFEPVDVRLARHLVHREFQREASLRPSGRAHRRGRPGVRIDAGFLNADIRASIDRPERTRAARTAADSAAAARHEIDRGQLAVAIDAHLDLLLGVRTVAGRAMLVRAREHHLHRHSGQLGQSRCNNNFGSRAEFRSEAAAEVLADHADTVGRQAEIHGEVVAHGKNALRRAPDREAGRRPR